MNAPKLNPLKTRDEQSLDIIILVHSHVEVKVDKSRDKKQIRRNDWCWLTNKVDFL